MTQGQIKRESETYAILQAREMKSQCKSHGMSCDEADFNEYYDRMYDKKFRELGGVY